MRSTDKVAKKAEELTTGQRFRIEQGMEVHRRAREIFTGGILIDEKDIVSAAEKTHDLIEDQVNTVIYESMFVIDGFAARADILKRNGSGWQLYEVKSSVNDRAGFIDDMAYTAMVIKHSGLKISSVSLLLISKEYRLGMDNEHLFVEIDHTIEVMEQVGCYEQLREAIEEITRSPQKPDCNFRFECKNCILFKECLGKDVNNHIFDLPRLSKSKFNKLLEIGVICIEDVPNDFDLTERQSIVRDCVKKAAIQIGSGLSRELESISWPAYYLDFETLMTAIPLFPEVAPFTQIPTQYSIHKCSEPGKITGHLEYLGDPCKDSRREFAENLIINLEGEGSIICYSSFEKTTITKLVKCFPDLSGDLISLVNRLKDLLSIIGKNFYHPEFHGSNSIKTTLPVIVPDMSYDELDIKDGDSAMATFAYLAAGIYEGQEAEEKKRMLLEYCKQDTLAMVKLHERLIEYSRQI